MAKVGKCPFWNAPRQKSGIFFGIGKVTSILISSRDKAFFWSPFTSLENFDFSLEKFDFGRLQLWESSSSQIIKNGNIMAPVTVEKKRIVKSSSGPRPHVVTAIKNGKYSCNTVVTRANRKPVCLVKI